MQTIASSFKIGGTQRQCSLQKGQSHPVFRRWATEERKPRLIANVKITAKSTHARTEMINQRENHKLVFDEPEKLGGSDSGPTPLEGLLGAYCGCLGATAEYVAKKTKFDLGSLSFEAIGHFDPTAYRTPNMDGPPTHFQVINLKATVQTTEDEDRMRELVHRVEEMCPISSLLKAANVTVDAQWVRESKT
eukprot:TRINITY_DN20334_c0_g1_i1.p1 TRINITY_DN20334_c0_g1~~TRINITY_DN20334_c0_g1_i1.p1  ORF type:complete len:191 (+),score=35.08 TRINITY_DN20334_c0_g1_i1:27-599(+)